MKDANLKMYHVMSVKQTPREHQAEQSYHSVVELRIGQGQLSVLLPCSLNH